MANEPVILVVDDNPVNRAVLFDYLDGQGYRVLVAETGEAGVEIVALTQPTVVLMDVMLPGIDGYEACRRIRSQDGGKNIPIIFMTALDDKQSKSAGYKAGGNAYVTKPVLYDEVSALLDTYVKLRKHELASLSSNSGKKHALSEFDAVIDMIAHDMKSPLVCILGFAGEIADDFEDKDVPEEWVEYLSIIKTSATDVDVILEALVLLKNLRVREWQGTQRTALKDTVDTVTSRYQSLENLLPIELKKELKAPEVMAEPTLLEELILIIWRISSNLNAETGKEALPIELKSETNDSGLVVLSIEAETREINEQELPHILEPMFGGKRKKVKDTNILTLCAQKLIEYLAINAWSEATEKGLKVSLSLSPPD